jgi:hypothetical protein
MNNEMVRSEGLTPFQRVSWISSDLRDTFYRMSELDLVIGDLNHIEEIEGGCLALIGKISVFLPPELAEMLHKLVGYRVGVLRLGGFHVRNLNA